MWGKETPKVTPTETLEQKKTRESQEFSVNLTKVTDAVKTPEQADKIATILDSNFQDGLKTLATTEEGKKQLIALGTDIAKQLTNMINSADKKALEDIQKLITPLTIETSTTTFDSNNTEKIIATGTKNESFNTTEKKWKELIANAIVKIHGDTYKNLPGKKEIVAALINSKQEDIASLQNFLFENLPKTIADKLADKSRQWNSDTGKRDGKYGEQTNAALTDYLDAYIANTDSTTKKTTAEQAATTVVTSTENLNALNTSKTTATTKLDVTFKTYKETDYTPTDWKSLTDANFAGQKSINAATTLDWATKGETMAEATMKAIPTIEQAKITNKETINTTITGLDKLQDGPNFKDLPKDIQRQINKILNLTARDDKVDKKIDESKQTVSSINLQITKMQTDNVKKWQEVMDLNKTITVMKASKSENTKQFEDQQTTLTTEIEHNNTRIQWLKNELINPQNRLERLQNRDARIAWRITEKLTDIAQILKTEINNRTVAIAQLDNEQAKTMLTNEIKTITNVQTDIQKMQEANTVLTQLENPVNAPAIVSTPVIVNAPAVEKADKWVYDTIINILNIKKWEILVSSTEKNVSVIRDNGSLDRENWKLLTWPVLLDVNGSKQWLLVKYMDPTSKKETILALDWYDNNTLSFHEAQVQQNNMLTALSNTIYSAPDGKATINLRDLEVIGKKTEKTANAPDNFTLKEEDLIHYESPDYKNKIEKLWTSWNNKDITMGEYTWKITSIDGTLKIDTWWWNSVSSNIKEISNDKIILVAYWKNPERIIYNHGEYADMNQVPKDWQRDIVKNTTEKFQTIETKFKALWYDFNLDQKKWTLKINRPQWKDIKTVQDRDIIWQSMDEQRAVNTLELNIKDTFKWIGSVYSVVNDREVKKNDWHDQYTMRAKSIIVSI